MKKVNISRWASKAIGWIKLGCRCHITTHSYPCLGRFRLSIARLFGLALVTLAYALGTVIRCLCPTPKDNLFILSSIQPTELCRQKVVLAALRSQNTSYMNGSYFHLVDYCINLNKDTDFFLLLH